MSPDQPEEMAAPRETLPAMIKKLGGKRNGDGSVSIRRWDSPEVVLYGPYWKLAAGTYRLEICCRSIRVRRDSVVFLAVEILVQNRTFQAVADYCLRDLPDGKAKLDFCVPEEFAAGGANDAQFEFRVLHFGIASLDIVSMTLARLSATPTGASALRWRLSSRLRRRWFLRWPKGTDLPAPTLSGGRFSFDPPLSLPRGAYALTFQASRRWIGRRAARWLDVSVRVGGHLRASRGYAVAGNSTAPYALEFEIPPDIALDHGANDRVAIEFGPRGSGSIHVTDVQLTKAPPPATSAVSRARSFGTLGAGGQQCVRTSVGRGRFELKLTGRMAETAVPSDDQIAMISIAIRPRLSGRTVRALREVMRSRSSTLEIWTVRAQDFVNGVAVHGFATPPSAGDTFIVTAEVERCAAVLSIESLSLAEQSRPEGPHGTPGAPALVGKAPVRVVIIGNCQAEVLSHGLSQLESHRLIVRYHFVNLYRNLIDRARTDLQSCDVLLVQDIADFENYPLQSEIPNDVLNCRFPMLRFSTPWPFDAHNGLPDRQAAARDAEEPYFLNLDGALGRLRREIPDPEARWQAYRRLDFDWGPDILRLSRFEERRLATMDQKYDFALGAYILDNFRKRPVFHSVGHPNGEVLSRLLQSINRMIGLHSHAKNANTMDHLRNVQVPIHPVVAQRLGIVWADERTRYQFRGSPVTWEEYTRLYIRHFG